MATKKAAAATRKVAATVSPEPEELQPAGDAAADLAPTVEAPLEAVDVFVAEVEDAPPSTITVAVGSCGYYTGARPAETLAQYKTRLGTTYGTFGDLGSMLGTAPKS